MEEKNEKEMTEEDATAIQPNIYECGLYWATKGKKSWVWRHISNTGQCQLKIGDNPCPFTITSNNTGNVASHVCGAKHGMTEALSNKLNDLAATKATREKGTRCKKQTMLPVKKMESPLELLIRFVVQTHQPLRIVEEKSFQALQTNCPIRKAETLLEKIHSAAEESRAQFKRWARDKNGCFSTLAYDAGTVFKRFLAVDLIVPGYSPLHVCVKWDGDMGGELSSPAIGAVLREVANNAEECGVQVAGYVADNAANMQSENVELSDKSVRVRCIAHVIQLIIKDCCNNNKGFSESVENHLAHLRKTVHAIPTASTTRWNWMYLALEAALKKKEEEEIANLLSPVCWGEIEEAKNFFTPFFKATMLIQSDAANQIDLLVAWQLCHSAAPHETVARTGSNFSNAAAVTVAFLLPTCDRTQLTQYSAVKHFVVEWCSCLCLLSENEKPQFLLQLAQYLTKPPKDAELTPTEIIAASRDSMKAFPVLYKLFCGLCNILPTEACVERMFSCLKLDIPRLRANVGPQCSADRLWLLSWYDLHQVEKQECDIKLRSTLAVEYLNSIQFTSGNCVRQRKRPRDVCAYCGKKENVGHSHFISCTTCEQSFSLSCLRIPTEEMALIIATGFECDGCRNQNLEEH